jgi:hypothetical protein
MRQNFSRHVCSMSGYGVISEVPVDGIGLDVIAARHDKVAINYLVFRQARIDPHWAARANEPTPHHEKKAVVRSISQ